jgi:predicted nucleic acid-binding protein
VTLPPAACFDSCILIDFLKQWPGAVALVVGVRERTISTLVRTEVLAGALTRQQWHEAQQLLDKCIAVDVDPAIADAAAQLRQQHRLKTPDVIIAATATARGLPLFTRDAGLAALPGAQLAY